MKFLTTLMACLMVGGCASVPAGKPDPKDPWERFNRASFKFNDALDRAVLRPTARAYVKVMPRVVRTGVSNVFSNLETVSTLINDALQGKMRAVGQDSARLLLNSTLGLGGLLDPATAAGIEKNDEDFGQTLGAWGVQSGPYLMVPFLGPSTLRDAIARVPDRYTDPTHYLEDDSTRFTITAVEILDLRAGLLEFDDELARSFDRYAFVRNAWLQRREYKVLDGNVEDDFEDDFEDDVSDEEPAPESPPSP